MNSPTMMVLDQLVNTAIIGCISFLAVLVLSKKTNTPIGYCFLSSLFVLLALTFCDNLLDHFGIYKQHPALIVVFQPSLYAIAPLIYLSVSYLTSVGKKLSPKVVVHFIPYLLVLSLYVMAYVFNTPRQAIGAEDADDKMVNFFLLFLFFLQLVIYLYFSVKQLKRHRLKLPLFVSSISDNDYHWLYKAIMGLSLISMISFAEVVFDQMHISFYFSTLYLIGFYYIGVQVARQKDVFPFSEEQIEGVSDLINDQQFSFAEDQTATEEIAEGGDAKSLPERKQLMNEETIRYHKGKLESLMERERLYQDSELTLPKLADLLKLNTYQTSYLINTSFGENFYSFVNRYRIERCKQMLLDSSYNNPSILGIAFEAGFNSKTAFNTAFKKGTGLSPKEFKEQIKTQPIGSDLSTR